MQYVKQEIKEFVETNLQDIYDEWNPNTTYTVETNNNALTNASMVRFGAFYYRSVTENNKGYNPVQYENIKWVKHSVSNKFAMLDMSANSKSVIQNGSITVVFEQNYIELLGFGNYEAEYIEVELLDSDMTTVLWSKNTSNRINENVYDYWDYIYAPYFNESDHTETMVIPLLGTYIRVTFREQPFFERASCGYLIGGSPVFMGNTLNGVTFGYNSFTSKEVTPFGNLEIIKRGVQALVDFETVIPSNYLPRMRRELKTVYDEIVLFVLDERENSPYENLMTLGVIQDAGVVLENPVESLMTFSVIEAV